MEATVTDLRQQVDEAHERLKAEQPPLEDVEGTSGVANMPEVPVEDLRVDGTAQLGLFDAGGKKATSATLTLQGRAIELVDGKAFRKGDRIHFEGVAVVREVGQRDKEDRQTGVVVSCKQTHTAVITDLIVRSAGLDGEAA